MSAESPTVFMICSGSHTAALSMMLEKGGYEIERYQSAEEFLDSFEPSRTGCALVDVALPGMTGLELQAKLKVIQPNLPIVFLGGEGDIPQCVQAMRAGAVDFFQKPYERGRLKQSISEALSRQKNAEIYDRTREGLKKRLAQLTRREREVLAQLVKGAPTVSSEQIAVRLHISRRTVEHHRAAIKAKMRARSLLELIDMARVCDFH